LAIIIYPLFTLWH